ncbi:hypothetical protein [Maricaulis salignorans]|uniref:Uncharacterized protein n=1 Tax=Maricaulis salignorans TaxID=144026 RepID=A0A1G9LXL5_9PROT|nr:hypothetical protein [Maricaulis salignorans]SDL66653.1 hypothetical protein SAMN04488568_101247 [Maricaulis salignorans]
MKQLRSVFVAAILSGAVFGAPATAIQSDATANSEAPAPSIGARALADQLLAILATFGEDADAAALETALINALVSSDQSVLVEAEALRLVIAETDTGAFRAAAESVLSRQPESEEGYVATAEYTGGLPAGVGDLVIPGSPPLARGGGSDY